MESRPAALEREEGRGITPPGLAQTRGVSIMAWNIRHGGGGRNMPAIALVLLEYRPEIIVLSEFRRLTGGQIAAALADHGWIHQHTTSPPPGTNGLLIASRLPFAVVGPEAGELPPVLCPRAAAAAALRRAELDFGDLGIIAAHIPCAGPERTAREHLFQCLLAAARRQRDTPCLVIGDLNAGRHRLDEAGATFTCTRLLGQLAGLGYVDAWRKLNGDSREFSWYSAQGAGFRLDHAFISPALLPRLACCRYAHEPRKMGLSDHSALLLGLSPNEPHTPRRQHERT
jgi:exodeoxyribonuclease III